MSDLKPCPFCGSRAKVNNWYPIFGESELGHYDASCTNEGCGIGSDSMETEQDAIKFWNTRHSPWIEIKSEDDLPSDYYNEYLVLASFTDAISLKETTRSEIAYISPKGFRFDEDREPLHFPDGKMKITHYMTIQPPEAE